VGSATNRQGEDAPEFSVAQWVSRRPDMKNKTVVIDFWATWCGPCRAAIPHMNELQQTFAEDLVCVGVSNESADAFKKGMSSRQLNKPNTFAYSLALDPSAKMQRHFGVRGIPHCVVISPDGKVRWQGHPSGLDSGKLGAIVKAGRGAGATFEPFWTKNKR
jgi:thiol-disulfide isomerase/thioredoxin